MEASSRRPFSERCGDGDHGHRSKRDNGTARRPWSTRPVLHLGQWGPHTRPCRTPCTRSRGSEPTPPHKTGWHGTGPAFTATNGEQIMKRGTIVSALTILIASSGSAQREQDGRIASDLERGCMVMSDSAALSLSLTHEQRWKVKNSNDRCLNACAISSTNPFGHLDATALTRHLAEMRKILSSEQYATWCERCSTGRTDLGSSAQPRIGRFLH